MFFQEWFGLIGRGQRKREPGIVFSFVKVPAFIGLAFVFLLTVRWISVV